MCDTIPRVRFGALASATTKLCEMAATAVEQLATYIDWRVRVDSCYPTQCCPPLGGHNIGFAVELRAADAARRFWQPTQEFCCFDVRMRTLIAVHLRADGSPAPDQHSTSDFRRSLLTVYRTGEARPEGVTFYGDANADERLAEPLAKLKRRFVRELAQQAVLCSTVQRRLRRQPYRAVSAP